MRPVRRGSHARAEAPLRRLRALLLGFALFTLALAIAMILGAGGSSTPVKGAVIAGLAALAVRWIRALRNARLPVAMDVGEVAVVLAAGIVAGPMQVFGLLMIGASYRSLYGGRVRVALGAALFTAAHLAAVALTPRDAYTLADALPFLSLLVLAAAVCGALRVSLARHERGAARERQLRETGQRLLGCADPVEVAGVVAQATVLGAPRGRATVAVGHDGVFRVFAAAGPDADDALGRELTLDHFTIPVREALQRGKDVTTARAADVLVARLPFEPRSGGLHIEPLLLGGELRGLLALALDDAIAPDEIELLRGLATLAALALEARELADRLTEHRAGERLTALLQNASDVITVLDAHGDVVHQTTAVQRILGHAPTTHVGLALLDLVHPDDRHRVGPFLVAALAHPGVTAPAQWQMRRSDGSWCWLETIANNLLDDAAVGGVVLTSRDVSERIALEAQLIQQAFHDPLTGLGNRELLHERLDHGARLCARREHDLALLLVDIDDFKAINDSHGHGIGDRVLIEVAGRLGQSLHPSDTLARRGGDEFAIVLEHPDAVASPAAVAQRLLRALRAPIAIDGERFMVAVSIGIVSSGNGAAGAEELLRDADLAMHEAKRRGKARYTVFEPGMHRAAVHRLNLTRDLRQAIERDELVLHYQPVVVVQTGMTTGLEALVRWRHPERGLLGPGEFIGLAEEEGLVAALGDWVLTRACRQARRWQREIPGCERLRIGVNVSRRQLDGGAIIAHVEAALKDSGLAPDTLVLEITESAMAVDTGEMVKVLRALHALGPTIAIDDFGTGYSSLSYLRHLPVQTLKLPREFVDDIDRGGEDAVLAHGIIELGHRLGLSIVAEGIERQEQLDHVRLLKCDWAQGYHLGRPVTAEETERLLHDQHAAALLAAGPPLAR